MWLHLILASILFVPSVNTPVLNYGPLTVTNSESFDAEIWSWVNSNYAWVRVSNPEGEFGNVAIGSWSDSWYTNESIPIKKYLFYVDFDIMLGEITYEEEEWLRVALVAECWDGENFWYTELDLWDSPNTFPGKTGLLHKEGDVVEYKVDQIDLGEWHSRDFEFTWWVSRGWGPMSAEWKIRGIYAVVEMANASAEVAIGVRNLVLRIVPRHPSPQSETVTLGSATDLSQGKRGGA